jgi:hypothetical protein
LLALAANAARSVAEYQPSGAGGEWVMSRGAVRQCGQLPIAYAFPFQEGTNTMNLMKSTQRLVLTVVCVLNALLLLGAVRYLPVLYTDWRFWAEMIVLALMLVLLVSMLPDLYRKSQ